MTKFEKLEDVLVYRRSVGFNGDKDKYDMWYDFTHGVDVGDDQINEWMQDAFRHVREDLIRGIDKTFATIRSGNTLVLLTAYRQDNGLYELSFVVSKSYSIADISDYDPSVEVEFVPLSETTT